jgi:hypothetical protein
MKGDAMLTDRSEARRTVADETPTPDGVAPLRGARLLHEDAVAPT